MISGNMIPSFAATPLDVMTASLMTGEAAQENSDGNGAPLLKEEAQNPTVLIGQVALQNQKLNTQTDNQYEDMLVASAEKGSHVNVRKKPGTAGAVVGIMKNNSVATVISEKDGWYKIKSGDVRGYISSDFAVRGDADLIESASYEAAIVKTETLRVRSSADESASVVGLVAAGEKLKVLGDIDGDWIKVHTSDGNGYVASDYVKCKTAYRYAQATDSEGTSSSTDSGSGSSVASYALQFVGNPYVWGGTSLTNGADCSGFIMSVYAHFGISLPHSSSALRSVGTAVSYSDMQPGDIICYSGHCALYIGGGMIVHASNHRDGIKVSPANYRSILAIRRVL